MSRFSLSTCGDGHEDVAFAGVCPLCEEIGLRAQEVSMLKDELNAAEDFIKKLESEIAARDNDLRHHARLAHEAMKEVANEQQAAT